mmetsp:Transcript_12450/g.15907  ORF Transcript_12450/g.15907 Transcript_12450/m.15907 type:complete len:166 (+) Transcript_12450:1488-1985(+)
MEKKKKKLEDIKRKYTCKKAVYENAKMLDPEGNLLCHTEFKKARWYVLKGLATVEKEAENELVVRLNFKPNATATQEDDEFYATSNRNACVRCGKDSELTRFHVVPSIYRTHLPETLKSHRSHDVVLLDFDCLSLGLKLQHKLKEKLSKEYDAPLREVSKYYVMN